MHRSLARGGVPVIERPTVNKISFTSGVRRWWMVLVVAMVVAVAGFCVYRLHGIFGSHNNTSAGGGISDQTEPFNPKHITLEVFGDPGAVATINYVDINVQPRQVLNAALPWSLTMVTTQPGAFSNLVAQGDSDSLGCRITVDGEVKDERIVNEVNAYTFCLVKSA
jgi:Mycobacterium membrane protein